jgi:hypothetical protein
MKWIVKLAALATLAAIPLPAIAAPTPALMYKNPSCSCCETYAAYLEQNGFKVDIRPTNNLEQISARLGVPDALQGCHTVVIDGYLIDGFVPADVVHKMLTERPAITGIALVGMPMGSPGMGGEKTAPFTIQAFTSPNSPPTVYAVE